MPLALLLALAAADPTRSLVGDWAFVDAHRDASMPVEVCATDYGIRYAADGTWHDFGGEERGTWRRRGDAVRERVTARRDDATGVDRRVREPAYTVRLRWLSRDHLNTVIDGEAQGLIRCPPAP